MIPMNNDNLDIYRGLIEQNIEDFGHYGIRQVHMQVLILMLWAKQLLNFHLKI